MVLFSFCVCVCVCVCVCEQHNINQVVTVINKENE